MTKGQNEMKSSLSFGTPPFKATISPSRVWKLTQKQSPIKYSLHVSGKQNKTSYNSKPYRFSIGMPSLSLFSVLFLFFSQELYDKDAGVGA
jgi:hypothetical protein